MSWIDDRDSAPGAASETRNAGGSAERSLSERLTELWAAHRMPERTGCAADKEFFDDLSGEALVKE